MTEVKEPAKAQLGDFIVTQNSKKVRTSTSAKQMVKIQNRFEELDEDRQMKELVLETGEIVDAIPPPPPLTPPPGLTTRRPKKVKFMERACACCPNTGGQAKEDHGNHGVYSVLEKNVGSMNGKCMNNKHVKMPKESVSKEIPKKFGLESLGAFFEKHEPVNSISEPEWIPIEVVMDSGAAESVAPSSIAPWLKLKASDGSREGREYLSASGETLKNLGEKNLEVVTNEGLQADTTFQIADVTRPLCSIAKVCDKGNVVVFDSNGGYVEDAWGHRTHFERKGNIYTMSFFALDPGTSPANKATSDFPRRSS